MLSIAPASAVEHCAGRATPPPSIYKRRRRRFLMIGAPPPPIICRRAADAILVCLITLLHFSCFAWIRYQCLPQCKIEVDILANNSCQIVRISGGSRGGANPAMTPHWSWQWSLAPLGDRKSNDNTVNMWKRKDFGPLRTDVEYGYGPPTEKCHIKTLKKVDD